MKTIIKACAIAVLTVASLQSQAAFISTSATDVEAGLATFAPASDLGWPTPFSPNSTVEASSDFFTTDDIRVSTRINLAALDPSTDRSQNTNYWNSERLQWLNIFYYYDGNDWNRITDWTESVSWDTIIEWQQNEQFTNIDFWTPDMRSRLNNDGQWKAGLWYVNSFFEGTLFQGASFNVTQSSTVNAPATLGAFLLGLLALQLRRRK